MKTPDLKLIFVKIHCGLFQVKASLCCNLENTSFPFAFNFHLSEWSFKLSVSFPCVVSCIRAPHVPTLNALANPVGPSLDSHADSWFFNLIHSFKRAFPDSVWLKISSQIDIFGFFQTVGHVVYWEVWQYSVLCEGCFGTTPSTRPEYKKRAPGCQSRGCQHSTLIGKLSLALSLLPFSSDVCILSG